MVEETSPDKLTIETPEQIPLEFPLAGIGSRFLAIAVDTLIQAGVALLLLTAPLFIFAELNLFSSPTGVWLSALGVLAVFLLQSGYFILFEALWNGQTPGKRYLHLRVIKDSGRPITVYDAFARNLLRIVDSLPGLYAVGIISMLLSSQNKRLGDYVAGTVVVHERPLEQQAEVGWTAAGREFGSDVLQISPQEFQLIEAFLLRRAQLAEDVRAHMAREIIARLAPKLQIPAEEALRPEPLLEALATEYRNRARFLG
jgi:uncharacterized RDD family membrane protein YckC